MAPFLGKNISLSLSRDSSRAAMKKEKKERKEGEEEGDDLLALRGFQLARVKRDTREKA